ncbi:PREDICTED: hydroperoxide isomerase ALOXE3-like [Nanorana parkeri]|uniref:hydroperoxide isomerase ALOXE3-like n=1 Tax=Nanorana parkeri TaxID=125878 RepID=UPI0008550BB4|nr:PREDICTED: hydroperoxide isomerase ALOXE3-like [Nanorana parkeri]
MEIYTVARKQLIGPKGLFDQSCCLVLLSHQAMGIYKLKVATGNDLVAGTCNNIFIVLVGMNGESDKHQLPRHWSHFLPGSVAVFDINVKKDLGELLLVRLSMERYLNFPLDEWFCQYVNVTCPSGQICQFPFYQWISVFMIVEIPEGKGVVLSENTHPALKNQRKAELDRNKESHKWKVYVKGAPHCIDVADDEVKNLPPNDQFSLLKVSSFGYTTLATGLETKLKGFACNTDSWHSLEDIKLVSTLRRSQNSELVSEIWKEDSFFGSLYLNGVNPTLIKKCFKVPSNFPVGEHIVAPSLGPSTNLEKELQSGHIFLADYKILEGVPSNSSINGQQQFIAAPLCLLWKNPQDQLVPIAIQLSQTPGDKAPVFLPSDSEFDWLLAKIWVRNSDFQVHEVDTHLLRTHLLAEVFSIATARQLPMGHPVYKAVVVGNGGVPVLLERAMKGVTYSSLCLPDNIEGRGMESIPNYLYREDGMKIWSAVESFVSSIVNYYYTSDEMVSEDPELQAWVDEIFKEGFLEHKSSDIPCSLNSKASLIRYLAMVIFTCSAQHAAVNSGQFDIYSWMPNGPTSMKSPPPSIKGATTMQAILYVLPDVNTTATGMASVWALSNEPLDRRPLGHYPDVRFTEETPQQFIKEFQDKLAEISKFIQERNKTMHLPYPYLDPSVIENSISI